MNEPVAWIWSEDGCNMGVCLDQDKQIGKQEFQDYSIPLYTHPHPDNLGLAESIIKQQQLKIDNLYENNARLDAEIDALKAHPVNPYQSITDTKIEPTVVSYTHPVTEHFEDEPQAEELHEILQSNAELTDEEILISAQYNGIRASEILDEYVIDFARAILRKAQEKC